MDVRVTYRDGYLIKACIGSYEGIHHKDHKIT
jgi:hypothetical protein